MMQYRTMRRENREGGKFDSNGNRSQEQEQRKCAAFVTVHVTQNTQLRSIYEVQPFKCLVVIFQPAMLVCNNMTACHIQAATHTEANKTVMRAHTRCNSHR